MTGDIVITIEIPKFWWFREPCSCPYGSLLADQSPHVVIVTEEQAWADFYEGEKRARTVDMKKGRYVTAESEFDTERFHQAHSHPACTRAPLLNDAGVTS